MRLVPMMPPTERCEVAVIGLAAACVFVDVVLVRPACRSAAAGEHAVAVAEHDELLESVGDLVGVDAEVAVEVDDGFDGHLGVWGGAPAADLVGQDEAAGVLHPRQVTPTNTGRAGERGL